jgi:hypothetical protein
MGLARGAGRARLTVNVIVDGGAFSDEIIRRASRAINGGDIGLIDRIVQTKRVRQVVGDIVS